MDDHGGMPSAPERAALASAAVRTAIGVVPLLMLWALAFTGATPFYPTITAGAAAMGFLAVWVWRTPVPHRGPPKPRREAEDAGTGPAAGGPRDVVLSFPTLRVRPAHVGLAAIVALTHYLAGAVLASLATRLAPAFTETAAAAYERAGTVPLWAAVLLGGVVSAPLEEVFWRGAVQPVLTAAIGAGRRSLAHRAPLVGIVAAAVAYALFHAATLQIALVAAAVLGGLVWGWLLHRTGSLGAAMIAHGLWTSLMLLAPPL